MDSKTFLWKRQEDPYSGQYHPTHLTVKNPGQRTKHYIVMALFGWNHRAGKNIMEMRNDFVCVFFRLSVST